MIPPPAEKVRRFVLAPGVVVLAATMFASAPLTLAGTAVASRFTEGRWRPLRVWSFLLLYVLAEVLALVALAALWIGAGFGRHLDGEWSQRWHRRLLAWFLRRVVDAGTRTFGLRVVHAESDPIGPDDGALVVLSRHAGPGDSLLVVDLLANGSGRHPRIVLKDLLQWDPAVDVLLHRLPSRFVDGRGGAGGTTAVAELAADMGARDALVIFPEGGNFTPGRRVRAIDRLRRRGRHDLAERAAAMEHVLAPRAGGALAALDAAPHADVLFVGHVGLEDLSTLRDLWRGLHLDQEVVIRWWRVAAADVPTGDREAWLFDWWERLDAWVGDERARRAQPADAAPVR